MNKNNDAALNQHILGISSQVEPNLYSSPNKNPLKNVRVVDTEILNLVGLGIVVLYLVFVRK
jgi:hypothetical protein